VTDVHRCYLCGHHLSQHVVYNDQADIPPDAVEGKFELGATGFYCPPPTS
jgi:hypothetical protein